jgi:adenylate cyclase
MFPKISPKIHQIRPFCAFPEQSGRFSPDRQGRCIRIASVTALPNQFDLGDLHVDLWSQRVTRAGAQIPLPKLSFDLLVALAGAAPKLVSIDELMTQVWPGLVVNPETVAQRVKMLRDALGDDPRVPRYIESVRSRGYRLLHQPAQELPGPEIPSVAEIPAPEVTPAPAVPQPLVDPRAPPRASRWRLLAGLLAVVLLIVAVMAIRAHRAPGPAAISILPDRTVAVLPFANIGGESKDALLASGIAENIRLRLGGLSEIVVIADTSMTGYNGTPVDAPTVGRELNARYLLEGSLQRQTELVRITARLVDAEKGADVWSVYFDRKPSDIFAVQDEIATKVARALRVTLDAGEEQRLQSRGTNNIDAYLEFLQARNSIMAFKSIDIQAAIAHFRKAIELDPNFSAAYSGLAGALANSNAYGDVHLSADQLKSLDSEARSLIERAQQLDPRNAETYMLLYDFESDPVKAESYLRHALALEPNSARAHLQLANSGDPLSANPPQSYIGDKLVHERKAMEIDPLNPQYPLALAGEYLFHRTNELTEVESLLMRSLELSPNYPQAQETLATLRMAYQRRFADGIKILEQILAQESASTYYRDRLAFEYTNAGDVAAAEDVIAGAAYKSSQIFALNGRHQWREAVTIYAKPEDVLPDIFVLMKYWFALRMDAHQSGNYAAARKFFEHDESIKWDKNGMPTVVIPMDTHLTTVISLADMLQKTGEPERARLILEASLVSIQAASEKFERGDLWLRLPRFQALALLGRDADALKVLEQMPPGAGAFDWREFEVDPIFDRLRHDPRFTNFLEQSRDYDQAQLALVQKMRDSGDIPQRPNHNVAQTALPP